MAQSINVLLILVTFIIVNIVNDIKMEDQQGLKFSTKGINKNSLMQYFITGLNNTNNSVLLTKGLMQIYNMWKPIDSYDKRREPNFVTFDTRDSEMTVQLKKIQNFVFFYMFILFL